MCFKNVSRVFQGRWNDVLCSFEGFQGSFKSILKTFKGCFKDGLWNLSRSSKEVLKNVLKELTRCFKGVSMKMLRSSISVLRKFGGISRVFQRSSLKGSFKSVSRKF